MSLLSTPHVLIVDDDPLARDLLERHLTRLGKEVLLAPDAATALDLLQKHCSCVSVILLDLAMPDVNGYELCRVIRTMSAYDFIRIFALTARPKYEVIDEALQAGMLDVIEKPCRPCSLSAVLGQ